jgi:hypothetical protein
MTCPACGCAVPAGAQGGNCPACNFPAGALQAATLRLYVVTGALFVSVLVYAVLAAVLTRQGGPVQVAGYAARSFQYAAWAISAVLLVVLLRWPAVPNALSPEAGLRQAIVPAALAETPAVLGLVATLMSGRLSDFVILLAVSLIMFVMVAGRIPKVAHAMREFMLAQHREKR